MQLPREYDGISIRKRHFAKIKEVIYYLIAIAIVDGKLYLRLHVFLTGVTRIVLNGRLGFILPKRASNYPKGLASA